MEPITSVTAEQLTRALGEAVIRIWSNLPQDVQNHLFQEAVCIENLIRFDYVTESHNVSANGRADILLAERGCLALQVEEPA